MHDEDLGAARVVKLKEFFYLLGLKPKPRTYGFTVEPHDLPKEGRVDVARWLHPAATGVVPRQAVVDQLRRFLRPGDVAIDIGAHAGDTTLPIALAVGREGVVLALEPNPYAFPTLERNAELNPGKTHIIPLNFAAMREDGTFEFQYGEEGYCNGGYHEGMSKWLHGSAFTVRVEGRNLAHWLERTHAALLPRLRFIKVDAEGFDLAILETLDGLIRRFSPYLQVEMFSLKKSTRDYRRRLYQFLVGHDYSIRRIEGDANYLGEIVGPETLFDRDLYDVLCVPRGAT